MLAVLHAQAEKLVDDTNTKMIQPALEQLTIEMDNFKKDFNKVVIEQPKRRMTGLVKQLSEKSLKSKKKASGSMRQLLGKSNSESRLDSSSMRDRHMDLSIHSLLGYHSHMDDSSADASSRRRRKHVTFTTSKSLEPKVTIHSYPSAVSSYCSNCDDNDEGNKEEGDDSICNAPADDTADADAAKAAKGELWYTANDCRAALHQTIQQILVANQMNIALEEGTTRGLEGYTAYGREQKEKAIEDYRQTIVRQSSTSTSSSQKRNSKRNSKSKTKQPRHSNGTKSSLLLKPSIPHPSKLQLRAKSDSHNNPDNEETNADILFEYSLGATQPFKDMANMMGYQDEMEAKRIYEQDGIEGMLTKQQGFVDTTVKIRLTSRLWGPDVDMDDE